MQMNLIGPDYSKIEVGLGYQFRNRELLKQAISPPSAGLPLDNQRLEFFGDSILNLCATRLAYNAHPEWKEGQMSRLRSKIVSTASLRDWALDLKIILEFGPRSSKKQKTSPKELADAMEALLAAVVLDSEENGENGIVHALAIVERRFGKAIRTADINDWERDDPKTALQEKAVALGWEPPVYDVLEKTGSDHAPLFFCSVKVGGHTATAKGPTKKIAEMWAARKVLEMMADI
jgi:ribonuclease-3